MILSTTFYRNPTYFSDIICLMQGVNLHRTFFEMKEICFANFFPVSFFIAIFFVSSIFFLPTTVSAGSIFLPPNNLGLVGYWSFEDTTGTIATDFSGNGNVGTLTNMDASTDWVAGKIGKALDFDGSNDYVNVPSPVNLPTGLDPVTLSVWFYLDSYGVSRPQILGYGGGQFHWFDVGLNNTAGGNFLFIRWYGTDTSSAVKPALNTWHHVAVIDDGTNAIMYLNGVQIINTTRPNTSTYTKESSFLRIGKWTDDEANDYFDGKIDDVRIYSRTLSATEITNLYSRSSKIQKVKSGITNNGLVGYWSFEDATGTKATDFSGQGNTGTLTNMDANTDWVAGKIGKALDFDGVDDYMTATASTLPTGSNPVTVAAWFYVNSYDNIRTAIAGYGQLATNYANFEMIIGTSGENRRIMIVTEGTSMYGTASVTTGIWHHGVIIDDGTNMEIYLDGQLDASAARLSVSNKLSQYVYIGDYINQSESWELNGKVDDVRIYNRALSATEILTLYNSTKSTKVNSSQNNKLTNGLVGLWSFDGPDISGTTAYDRSGNANNGTLTGSPSLIAGRIGQGMSFDGVNDYANITSADSIKFTSTFSASAWINPDSITVTEKFSGIVGKGGYGLNSGWELVLNRDNTGAAAIGTLGFVVKQTDVYTSTVLSVGRWYHVVVTFDGSTKRIYLNGVLDNSEAGGSFTADDQLVYIGVRNPAEYHFGYFEGDMDDVRIYNRALSTSEIQMLYNIGR